MSTHKIIIEPNSSTKHYWKEIWYYRELLFFLAWRDLSVRYKQTVIGVAWSIIRPGLTIGLAAFINWINNKTVVEGIPVLVLSSVSTIPWILFSSVFSDASNSLISNANLLTKVYFPRLLVPISTLVVCLVDFLVSLLILIVVMLFYKVVPGPELFLMPVFVLLALMAAGGAGCWMASLNVKYRDFRYIIPVITQAGLFLSPVLFSSSSIYRGNYPEFLKYIWSLNPMVVIIEGFKVSFLGFEKLIFHPGMYLSLGISFLLLFFGIRYFRRTEKEFSDVI